jgi:O-antigen/teichoic acid export membrane protein
MKVIFNREYILTVSRLINIGGGFVFWILANKFYSNSEIGIGSNIINIAAMIGSFSLFGLNLLILTKFNKTDKNSFLKFNIILVFCTSSSLIIGILTISLGYFFRNLLIFNYIHSDYFMIGFIILLIASNWTITYNIESYLVVLEQESEILIKNLILVSIRFIFLLSLFVLPINIKIELIFAISLLLSNLGIIYLTKLKSVNWLYFSIPAAQDIKFAIHYFTFSQMVALPILIINLFMLERFGSDNAGQFFYSWSFYLIILTAPQMASIIHLREITNLNLFEIYNKSIIRLLHQWIIIFIQILFFYFIGKYLINLFLSDVSVDFIYLNALLLSFSAFPVTINSLILAILRAKDRLKVIYFVHSISLIIIIPILISSSLRYGIFGLSIGWIFFHVVTTILLTMLLLILLLLRMS